MIVFRSAFIGSISKNNNEDNDDGNDLSIKNEKPKSPKKSTTKEKTTI